jgi:hypothetical protein
MPLYLIPPQVEFDQPLETLLSEADIPEDAFCCDVCGKEAAWDRNWWQYGCKAAWCDIWQLTACSDACKAAIDRQGAENVWRACLRPMSLLREHLAKQPVMGYWHKFGNVRWR